MAVWVGVGGRRLAAWPALVVTLLRGFTLNPVAALAAPRAPQVHGQTVRSGHLRLQVLTPPLLRLEYAADDAFEDRPTFNAVDRTAGRTWFTAGVRGGGPGGRTPAGPPPHKGDSGAGAGAETRPDPWGGRGPPP